MFIVFQTINTFFTFQISKTQKQQSAIEKEKPHEPTRSKAERDGGAGLLRPAENIKPHNLYSSVLGSGWHRGEDDNSTVSA